MRRVTKQKEVVLMYPILDPRGSTLRSVLENVDYLYVTLNEEFQALLSYLSTMYLDY